MKLKPFTFRDSGHRKQSIEFIYQDDNLLAVNKPAGLPVIADRWNLRRANLKDLLTTHLQRSGAPADDAVFVVHRLDAGTSGILLIARNAEAHRQYNRLFQDRLVEKSYLAITAGRPPADRGEIDLPLRQGGGSKPAMEVHRNGKASITVYEVIEVFRQFSLLKVTPLTGRQHQIRVHLRAINCPLAVDPLYGNRPQLDLSEIKPRYRKKDPYSENTPLIQRLTLHAHELRFVDPLNGERREFQAPPPKDFSGLLRALRKWGGTAPLAGK